MVKVLSLSALAVAQASWVFPGYKQQTTAGQGGQTVVYGGAKKNCKWLPWGAWASCRGVCGSGVQTRVRRCLNGIAGKDCQGNTLDSRACTEPEDDTCSYWSGWGQWSAWSTTCGTATRTKSRTCYGRSTDHCHGPTEIFDTIEHPQPALQTYCDPTTQKCCPYNSPNCCVKQCYTTHACTNERTLLPLESCDMKLPCCDEWSPYSDWSAPTASCFTTSVTRQRYNLCNADQKEFDSPKEIDLGDGNFGQWTVANGCDGTVLQDGHVCPGKITFSRDHSCYSPNLHTTDRNGQALQFSKIEQCGSLAKTALTEWDRTSEQCAQLCKNRGIFRSRKEVQPCTGEVLNEELEACGVDGGWGPMSEWTQCTSTCGGTQWRWQLHTCNVDAQTGRPAVNYEQRACYTDPAAHTWGEFGAWSDTCPSAYPGACVDSLRSRSRFSACGVKDTVTGVVQYEQTETASCPKPVLPPPVVTISECSASCVDENTPASYKIKTTTQHCVQDQIENIPCAVPDCCKWILEQSWSECDCTGTQYWMKQNTCSYIAAERITRSCMKPVQPYQPPSEWSACSSSCPEQGTQTRFQCPRCEANVATCVGAQREVKPCEGVNPRTVVEEPCVASCGQEGQKLVYDLDVCTQVKYNERIVACTLPIAPRPAWDPWGECVHDRGNVNCPGQRVRKLPQWIDSNTNQVCAAEDYQIEACGPSAEPANVFTELTPCLATTRCVQEKTEYNTCTGYRKVHQQACELPIEGPSMWSQCKPIALSFDKQHICDGTQSRVSRDPCGRKQDVYETKSCGLKYQLADQVELTRETFFSSVYHYYDCPRNALKDPMWSGCTAQCPTEVNYLSVDEYSAKGVEMISRKSICPNEWKDITISRECTIPCVKCDEPMAEPWTECSSDCEVGVQTRRWYKMCMNYATGKKIRFELAPENKQCGAPREEVVQYTGCVSANACGAGVFCGAGTRQMITTAVSRIPTCPAERRSIQISSIDEPCPLPKCPVWGPFQGDSCGMCDTSRTLYRSCQKVVGAETCECTNEPAVTTEMCTGPPPQCNWNDWTTCSKTCGVGVQSRQCINPCGQVVDQTESRTCALTMGDWLVIAGSATGAFSLVPVTAEAGWSGCSSYECVSGTQTRTLRHTCTGEEKIETRTCLPAINPNGGDYESQEWVKIAPCSQTCGEGLETWSRPHSCKKYNNLPDEVNYTKCVNPAATPLEWDDWSACPGPCSNVAISKSRSRRWTCGGYGTPFQNSQGLEVEQGLCVLPTCARWSEWKYTPCNCNRRENGYRTRECLNSDPERGITCEGASSEIVPCNNQEVQSPLMLLSDRTVVAKGMYTLVGWKLVKGEWSDWSACALTCHPSGQCGTTSRQQYTYCVDNDGQYQEGTPAVETQNCPCAAPVSTGIEWGACSAADATTCPGIQIGTENFTCGLPSKQHTRPCGVGGTWLEWARQPSGMEWGQCSATCNGGIKTRSRRWSCAADQKQDQIETAACNEHLCNYYGAWSNWGACSVSCGIGSMTRTRYCHGGNDGTGLCITKGGVGKVDTAKCDMGQCCEWDWSGWTNCCYGNVDGQPKNIRLRFRGNKCGSDWEVIQKTCEANPIPNPANPQFISCDSIKQNNMMSYNSGVDAKWANFINPDTQTSTEDNGVILQGRKLGHKDDPNTVASYNINFNSQPVVQPSASQFYYGRDQVPYNSQPYVAPVVSQPVVQAIQPPQYVINQATGASSKTIMAAKPAPAPVAPVVAAPAPAAAAPVVSNTTVNKPFSFIWQNPFGFKVNSNVNTHSVTGN